MKKSLATFHWIERRLEDWETAQEDDDTGRHSQKKREYRKKEEERNK